MGSRGSATSAADRLVPTFSIVARGRARPDAKQEDEAGQEWGVAVASKFLAVGSVVPWAKAGVGAVATQAFANPAFGPDGLALLAEGKSAPEVVAALTAADEGRDDRQVGIVDVEGRAATFTGSKCFDWAGGRTGTDFACQGNILTGAEVVDRMAIAFEAMPGHLPERLLAALEAGDLAGGDSRGRQSAALLVVRVGGGYLGGTDVSVDLRVDDHPAPLPELRRLYEIHKLLFPRPEELDFMPIDAPLATELRAELVRWGYSPGAGEGYDEKLTAALFAFVGRENLEERWRNTPEIEKEVLAQLRRH